MPTAARPTAPTRLPWTGDDEANRLIAGNPTALLIGFVLDQQVTVQKAFAGPLVMLRRLGTIDAAAIAALDSADVEAAFRRVPAIHRFPNAMAGRVQALCAEIAQTYDGNAARIWQEAGDAADLARRLGRLPGFGAMKVRTVMALLAAQYGVRPPGIEGHLPTHPTLGEVTTAEELERYQAGKRAHKAAMRAQAGDRRPVPGAPAGKAATRRAAPEPPATKGKRR